MTDTAPETLPAYDYSGSWDYFAQQTIPGRIIHGANEGGVVDGDDAYTFRDMWRASHPVVGRVSYNVLGECWEFVGQPYAHVVKGEDVPPDWSFRDEPAARAYALAYAYALDGAA